MSHQPERKQKNCLNCGIMVKGRYCHRCGQENIVTKQSFWSITTHFIFDLFHFDGKFFETLKTLFAKPGRVAREYVSGRRTKYLDPVRMYLFTSAVFFLIFFSTSNFQPFKTTGFDGLLSRADRLEAAMDLNARNLKDSLRPVEKQVLFALLDSNMAVQLSLSGDVPDDSAVIIKGKRYRFSSGIDSSRFKLPDEENTWLGRVIQKKTRKIFEQNRDDPETGFKKLGIEILHRLPYMLFLSLPFFALILKLIYAGKKELYYSDHIIFTLYHYIFSFLLILVLAGLAALFKWLQLEIFLWFLTGGVIFWIYYLYKGLRVFYGESRSKTVWKFILLNFLGMVAFVFLIVVFALFSIIEF